MNYQSSCDTLQAYIDVHSVGSSEWSDNTSEKARKKAVRTHLWKRHVSKKALQFGQEYVSSRGEKIPAKTPCLEKSLCNCRIKCSDKFSSDQRANIFTTFYEMDENAKNVYIFHRMKPIKPQCLMLAAQRHKRLSFPYIVMVDANEQRVCRHAFTSLHRISSSKLEHIGRQLADGCSAPHPCHRGKHSNRPSRLSSEQVEHVKEHINMFPADESHYSHSVNTRRKHLSPLLNITIVYKLYKSWCHERKFRAVSQQSHRTVFNSHFNLNFGHPKSDTCNICDAGDDDEHRKRAADAFSAMKQDCIAAKQTDDVHFITFDMQKTLPLPKLSTNITFYLRQLWLYNVGIHHISKNSNQAYFNIWTENESGHGSQEVASAIMAFLDNANINGGKLTAWSDSCAGQNKNWNMICFWQYLIASGRIEVVDHKFPESGHSFLDSDRNFAKVEQRVRLHKDIYSVDDYHTIMARHSRRCRHLCAGWEIRYTI